MGNDEMKKLAGFMDRVLRAPDDSALLDRVAAEVKEMCSGFPPPGIAV
jgi:glycine hydroxymethyltransferase